MNLLQPATSNQQPATMYLTPRFYTYFVLVALLFGFSFAWGLLFPFAQSALAIGLILIGIDAFLLFRSKRILSATRVLNQSFRLGDENPIRIDLQNESDLNLEVTVIDELPAMLQVRDFLMKTSLQGGADATLDYLVTPNQRGLLPFGNLLLFARTVIGFLERKVLIEAEDEVSVYPAVDSRLKEQLKSPFVVQSAQGFRQIRKLGTSMEFEQINPYVRGDDYRHINWKATGRHGELMVNRYQDEQAQQIYCVVDHGRTMAQAFNGLRLLDYSINASLALSQMVVNRHDRAGLISFGKSIHRIIRADKGNRQLFHLREALFSANTTEGESDLEKVYQQIRKSIRTRSLLVLFTQMESNYALERRLPVLRRLSRFHALVVVFFINTDLEEMLEEPPPGTPAIYQQALARKRLLEQETLAHRLRQYGIQVVLTRPENLTVEVINKYLELKARRVI